MSFGNWQDLTPTMVENTNIMLPTSAHNDHIK